MPFDESKARRAKRFFESYLRHTKGKFAGTPFLLQDWQYEQIIKPVFGTVKDDGTRQYRKVLLEIPRKNGKSEVASGIALYCLTSDGEMGGEVYSAGSDRSQASLIFDTASSMVDLAKPLRSRCKVTASRKTVSVPLTNSKYSVVSADGRRQHGLTPSAVLFDEIHTQRSRQLWDAMSMGSGTRVQPLVFALTTYGVPGESPVWDELHNYARQVREGVIEDPSFRSIHFGASLQDDLEDPRVWKKANPALGTFLSLEQFKEDFRTAKNTGPSAWNEFLRYRLNVLVEQADRWLPLGSWDACGEPIDWDAFHGKPCFLGLDLSTRRDLTAIVAVFPLQDGRFAVRPWFFLPEENVPDKLKVWVKKGFITTTPGNTIDIEMILEKLDEIRQTYSVNACYFDRYNAQWVSPLLHKIGIPSVEVGFNLREMSVPTREMEARILEKRIVHDGNPVMRWNVNNVVLREGPNGSVMPDKPKRNRTDARIDGVAALLMASLATLGSNGSTGSGLPEENVWNDPEFLKSLLG